MPLAEIAQGPGAFEMFLERNQKSLLVLVVLIALGVAGYVIYRGIEQGRQETAGQAFTKAADLPALQAVVNEHADTLAGHSALVLLAEKQWEKGDKDASIETLRKFISGSKDHPALPAAQASLGYKLMSQGKSGDAAKVFQDIVEDPKARYLAPYALISLGDMSKTAGDTDKAESHYKRVKTEFSGSSFSSAASKRIDSLRAKAPVEIAPPPKPEPPPAPPAGDNQLKPIMPGLSIPEVKPAPADSTENKETAPPAAPPATPPATPDPKPADSTQEN